MQDFNKIAIGSVQFGLNYGINNKRGKIPELEVFDILNLAHKNGIDVIDTARSYGDSEAIIGRYFNKCRKHFSVISKLPKCSYNEIKEIFLSSLKELNLDTLYGYLFHNFQHYSENPGSWDILEAMKKKGHVKKLGFSLYFPSELEQIFNNIDCDIIQIPYSIFDRRFESYFSEIKKRGIELHVRSIFLQGLVFKKPEELNGNFRSMRGIQKKLHDLSRELGISIAALCLQFGIINRDIDRIVVGIDSLDNFKKIIESFDETTKVEAVIEKLRDFEIEDEKIILPFNWS